MMRCGFCVCARGSNLPQEAAAHLQVCLLWPTKKTKDGEILKLLQFLYLVC